MNIENMEHRDKTRYLQKEIKQISDDMRIKYPILKHQNALGLGIMLTSIAIISLSAYAYTIGVIPAWLCVIVAAVAASFVHELEHDLIHYMYFKNNKIMHHLMMLLCWVVRPGTISPWVRRFIHLKHHKVSGTPEDIEEKAITNGMPWGLKRLIMMMDPFVSMILGRDGGSWSKHVLHFMGGAAAFFPIGSFHFAVWYSFLVFHGTSLASQWFGFTPEWPTWFLSWVQSTELYVIVFAIPHFIRQFSLNFISSNMHYFGDIEEGNVVEQTQVINAWWLAPFHLFCFNFGATHAIHHFVVRDPFYIRQLTAKRAYVFMEEMGVRFNDYGTFGRSNRYSYS